ncbi:BA75_05205T0 [Komagataella pastoris]|uniref:Phospholipid-transporting ATPase n=1 Tax=Komagataella pastoris TaxID=4922 RepID=A0A1B2JIN3_PICPA|nr:BA75_05205T0 [Komagataella pastoris]
MVGKSSKGDTSPQKAARFDENMSNGESELGRADSILKSPNPTHLSSFHLPRINERVQFNKENDSIDEDREEEEGKMKRMRWGTTRHASGRPKRSKSIWRRNTVRRREKEEPQESNPTNVANDQRGEQRKIFHNLPLDPEMLAENGEPRNTYPRNKIRTTKYTPLSFIPKNIAFQFRNIANIYFLTMIILGAFDIFGVPNPALSAVPLIVIVIITAIKDAIEDSRRTGLDMEINNQITHLLHGIPNPNVISSNVSLWRKFKKANTKLMFAVLRSVKRLFKKSDIKLPEAANNRLSLETMRSSIGEDPFNSELKPLKFSRDYWKEVKVGDIIRIKNNDSIPADVCILATSDEDGACYVETKDLDGETNLKVKNSLKCTSSVVRRPHDLDKLQFHIDSEGPHHNLYSYQGNFVLHDGYSSSSEPITINNLLLRGCSLRNTKWAIGVVIFTGVDTKIMINAGITPTKKSKISRDLNYSVLLNFLLLFILCLVSGLVNGIYYTNDNTSRTYFEFGTIGGTPAVNGIISFFVAVILYQSLVPISLYVSIEIIKTAQAFFIYSDVKMYYPELDYPCTPKSWNISDDLGQIEYIFSDKTGTLTQNVMEFKKCTINGVSYGRAYTEAYAGIRKRQGIDVEEESSREKKEIEADRLEMFESLQEISKNSTLSLENLTFVSKLFVDDLKKEDSVQKHCNENFMLALGLCHTVVTEENPKTGKVEFKAQSPDEAALVSTASDMGFTFVDKTKKGMILNVQGEERQYQILSTLEFNSTRKRMSTIIKIPPTSPDAKPKALLICKGADSVIYERLSKTRNNTKMVDRTAIHLEQFATEGLRTLCIAQRELQWEEYEEWAIRHDEAAASITDREERLEECADSIERELILLGGTAIEDRLQDGVPDAIELLGQAGIKLWVLTGDKVETAINIGFSCNLLGSDMDLLIIKTHGEDVHEVLGKDYSDTDEKQVVQKLISKYLEENFDMQGSVEELMQARKEHNPPSPRFGLIIDGDALKIALQDDCKRQFLLLCKQCKAVLCCRVSPAQKAAVVKLVKDSLNVMTLAIGDGSNDVAMIQAAHVGVGIAGEEGRAAAMSSDYAFGQFRYLARLVLVHGRWSYKRLAEMIPSFFYKNVIFTLALFWYGIYNNFDGSYLFEFTYLMFYNLAFTSLPVIFMGIFDQDVSDVVSLLVPQLYKTGILRSEWTQSKFWWYMGDGFYQSVICFFYPYLMYYKNGFVTMNGLQLDHRYLIGTVVATISILACNIYILFHINRWDWLTMLSILFSIVVLYAWTGIWSSSLSSGEYYKAAASMYGTLSFWVCSFVGVVICLIPRFTYDFFQKLYFPKDIDVIRECADRGDFSQYPDDYDPTDPNRKKISQYSRDMLAEQHPTYKEESYKPTMTVNHEYRDSINGVAGKRGSFMKSIFHKKNKNEKDANVARYNAYGQSASSLQTEEIEMEFTSDDQDKGAALRMKNSRQSFESRRRGSLNPERRASLNNTRLHMIRNGELDENPDTSPSAIQGIRTSMDFPELTAAETLVSLTSK